MRGFSQKTLWRLVSFTRRSPNVSSTLLAEGKAIGASFDGCADLLLGDGGLFSRFTTHLLTNARKLQCVVRLEMTTSTKQNNKLKEFAGLPEKRNSRANVLGKLR